MLKYLTKNNIIIIYDKEINISKGSIIFAILDQWPLMMSKYRKCFVIFQYQEIRKIEFIRGAQLNICIFESLTKIEIA